MTPARSIDEVLLKLTEIIEICKHEQSRLGYFPALYRRVTESVKANIESGQFEDGPRMERLDVAFANRYFEAWDAWRSRRGMTLSWRLAFEAGARSEPVILQHLLCGMNAHINLDLAIVTAASSGDSPIVSLKNDFDKINQILAGLIGQVERELAQVCPLIELLTKNSDNVEGCFVDFDIRAARGLAWEHAVRLALLQKPALQGALALAIRAMDAVVAAAGQLILRPGPGLQTSLLLVRAKEENDALKVIAALA